MRHSLSLTLIVVLLLCACKTKSLNTLYDRKTEKADIESLVANKSITTQEQGSLQMYLLSHIRDSSLTGQTYASLLQSAKLAESLALQKQKLQQELNKTIEIKVLRKNAHVYYVDGVEHRALTLDITALNTSEKRIAGFSMELAFRNSTGVIFYSAGWTLTNSIEPHSKINIGISTGEYDPSDPELLQLNIADLRKVQYESKILKLLYDDGTSRSVN